MCLDSSKLPSYKKLRDAIEKGKPIGYQMERLKEEVIELRIVQSSVM